jgi:putative DNA primase/helicase
MRKKMTNLLAYALELREQGFAPIPMRTNGSKAPSVKWKSYFYDLPTEDEIERWFTTIDTDGLSVITGYVSGNLMLFEAEGRALHMVGEFVQLMRDNGLGELWDRIDNGWVEQSPSTGMHWYIRISGDEGAYKSTKLAASPENLCLFETKGNFGYTVVAPSGGRTHESGKAWEAVRGSFLTCPVITTAEREQLFAIASMMDQSPPIDAPEPRTAKPRQEGDPIRPGDDFNARATWDEILIPHGWVKLNSFNNGYGAWQRPGGWQGRISATTGKNDADNLYVFSTSTVFETEVPISKFAAFAILEHGNDFGAAAKALAAKGYGARKEEWDDHHDDLAGLIPPKQVALAIVPPLKETTVSDRHLSLVQDPLPEAAEPITYFYTETDDGNALRLVDKHQGLVHYCPQRGSWLTWDTHKWVWDEEGRVYELARRIARNLPTADKDEAKHRKLSLSRRSIEAMVKLAEHDSRAVVHLEKLDSQPYELNTPDGVLDLRTAKLRAPDPAALHTRSTTVGPDFDAVPTQWMNFLADTFAGDIELTTYMQRLLGLSLIGTVLEQLLPFGFGSGANGKTTLVGVIQRIVGIGDGGYSISAPADMLVASNHQGHPTEIARLAGARLVIASELEDGQHFAEAKIKQLTGRDVITGRFMRQDWFSFTPTHTLWLLANFQPAVRAGGPAFWRRLRLLPFLHTVPPEARIADLEDRLVNREGPAILAWLARGAADYLAHGLAEPASVKAATEAYQVDQDTVGRFVEENCVISTPGAQGFAERTTTLRAAYDSWCHVEGESPVSAKALTMALRSRFGILSERTNSERFYTGIRLDSFEKPVTQNLSPENDSDEPWYLK